MINEDNLRGTVVMMHPDMWETHADQHGVVGEIVRADTVLDDFYVTYGGPQPQLHSADALLVLKETDDIYEHLQNFSGSLAPADFHDLKTIALLVDHGSAKHLRTALELVTKNPNILEAGTSRLDDVLGLSQHKSLKR